MFDNSRLDIRTPKDDVLENISAALHVNKEYLKKPDYPYTENNLMRFLFKLDDSIEVNIRPVILNDEEPEYTTTGVSISAVRLFLESVIRLNSGMKWKRNMRTTKLRNKYWKIGRLIILTAWKKIMFLLKKAMWNFIEKA